MRWVQRVFQLQTARVEEPQRFFLVVPENVADKSDDQVPARRQLETAVLGLAAVDGELKGATIREVEVAA